MKRTPIDRSPKFASNLLHWFGDNALIEDLAGDFEELFRKDVESKGAFNAKLTYFSRVLSIVFSGVLKKRRRKKITYHSNSIIHPVMIQNYFKVAWRIVSKNKIYSIINVFGLSLGVCACLSI
ncbi:MAG: permease prefix domain 2-containing transporter, partial [Chryseolinea sp.]